MKLSPRYLHLAGCDHAGTKKWYTNGVTTRSWPSASVVAAGITAIVCSLVILAAVTLSLSSLLFVRLPPSAPSQPPFMRGAAIGFAALALICSFWGVAAGIGLFLRRNWARISAMVWAGISFFFGLIGIPIALFMSLPTAENSPGLPENFTLRFRLILLAIYGAPLAVGIWWLILFSRKTIKEQFTTTSAQAELPVSQGSRLPVPIVVLAWFFITSAANVIVLPFLPFPMRLLLFGHLISSVQSTFTFVIICALYAAAGIGLLKVKPWSYPLAIALQLFWITSAVLTALNPNFDSLVTSMIVEINRAMHLPPEVFLPANMVHNMRWFIGIGSLVPIAVVAILFYYRERFFEAGSASKT